ncbi:Mu transposase domain-containing protein [Bradyrhizobium frederickii]|uniref:Mu transposase domain-containing protein n=1 Tax=Bradyrhizobium frederickii TaxID=2560054 RepID=UPI003D311DC7
MQPVAASLGTPGRRPIPRAPRSPSISRSYRSSSGIRGAPAARPATVVRIATRAGPRRRQRCAVEVDTNRYSLPWRLIGEHVGRGSRPTAGVITGAASGPRLASSQPAMGLAQPQWPAAS